MPALAKEFNDESFQWNIKIVSKNTKSTIFGMTDVTDSKVKSALVLLSDLDKVANFIKMENLGFSSSFNNASTFLLVMIQNSSRIRTSVSDMNLNLNLASNVYTASNSNVSECLQALSQCTKFIQGICYFRMKSQSMKSI